MISVDSPVESGDQLQEVIGADGSLSLFSVAFAEGFHGSIGARLEAESKFVRPCGLDRFASGQILKVVDVGVGLGTNTAALAEALQPRNLKLRWWGLEVDPRPLQWAVGHPQFRRQWQGAGLDLLDGLARLDRWQQADSSAQILWGDARERLPGLLEVQAGDCDLVLMDAFSPRRCPQLWTLEFLSQLAALLAPDGRLLTYSSAAAVRSSLRRSGLEVAALTDPAPMSTSWSFGTVASPSRLLPGVDHAIRELHKLECEHLSTRAAEPYRDPTGRASAEQILRQRALAQSRSDHESTSAWRRRWFS